MSQPVPPNSFYTSDEQQITRDFLEKGYLIRDVVDRPLLDLIRTEIVTIAAGILGVSPGEALASPERFLNSFHERCDVRGLNAIRMETYQKLNAHDWFRPSYFSLGRRYLEALIGNELAMQNRVNLSIQLPNDNSSLLPIHSDSFSGESPFQMVMWIPMVDVYKTKSMFILNPKRNLEVLPIMNRYKGDGMQAIYGEVEKELKWLDVKYGQVLIFSPNLLHGNIVNVEPETRWSFNCRFKGLFTPYNDQPGNEKKLGPFYLPITTRPASKVGMNYNEPSGF